MSCRSDPRASLRWPRRRRRVCSLVATFALPTLPTLLVAPPTPAAAQLVVVDARGIQRSPAASGPGYTDTPVPGCADFEFTGGSPRSVAASADCAYRGGRIRAGASGGFGDPLRITGGVTGGLDGQPAGFDNLTLASASALWGDRITQVSTRGGPRAVTATFVTRVDGGSTLRNRTATDRAYTQGFVGLWVQGQPTQPFPWGPASPWSEWVNFESDGLVRTTGRGSFDGTHQATGDAALTTVSTDGLIRFQDMPLLVGGTRFSLRLGFVAVVFNDGAEARDVGAEAEFDYGRSLVLDRIEFRAADGTDVTARTRARLGSGLMLVNGAPTVVPEPATVGLLAAGLGCLVGVAGLRGKRAERDPQEGE